MSESKSNDSAAGEALPERLARLEAKRKQEAEEAREKTKASNGVFRRPKIVHREVIGATTKVEILEFEAAEACEGAVFLSGVPGGNMTSLLTAGYFAKQLDLPLVACLRVHGATPQGIVKDNQPGVQVRLVGDSRMVCLLAERPIKGGGLALNTARALLSFCARRKIKHLFCVDAYPSQPDSTDEDGVLRFCTSSDEFSATMKEKGHVAIMNAILPGFAGQLLADAVLAEGVEDMHVSAVLAKADERLPSAYPAVHVVSALNEFLTDIVIDISDLEDSALEMETAIKKVMAEAKAQSAPKDAPHGMYM